MRRKRLFIWLLSFICLVALLLVLSSDKSSLLAQEPSPTEVTALPPPSPDPPPIAETATLPDTPTAPPSLPPTDLPAETPLPTNTETTIPSATVTDFPTFTPVQTIEVFPLPTLPETIAPSPPDMVPAGPVVLLNETAEGETSSWHFSGGWGRSNLEEAHTGDWFFSDSPGTFYTLGTTSTLSLAQPLSLPPGARIQLQYWQRLDLADGDSAQVQVSTDNANWVTVVSEAAVRNLAWTVRTVRLDSYAGQSIWLRFVLSSDADPMMAGEGWWLDDITIWAEPLPVTPRVGLSIYDSDDLSLWFAEGSWHAVGAPVHSGGLAWTTTSQPETATALTLNADISLVGMNAPELRFWHKLNLTSGEDRAQVELSPDGGQTWQPIVLYPGITTASDWNEQIISLSTYAGQTLRIRFLLIVGPNELQSTNWTIDTVTLQSGTSLLPITSPSTEASMPVASTPTDTPISPILQPPAGDTDWVTYQDTDQLLVYEGGAWTTFAVAGANGGTLTATADKGATLNIAFEGTAIEVIYSKGPEGGSFSGQIWRELIDYRNSNWDSYTYGHIFLFEDLMPGSHLLTITNGDGALWIEAIRVRGALLPHDAFEVAPSSVNWPTGSHFYLGQESQELTMLSSPIPYWFYDSVEWVNLPAASNPVVGICYTATLQGEGGIQFAEMGSYLDGYGDPWKSFWWDSSGPGPGTYPTCITDGYLPPNSGWISPAEVCAQACPFATRISNLGDWPKYQDGDYVATWKIGWYRAGTLQISDIRLIYYSSSPPVTETPTPTITPIPTNTPRFTPTPSQTPTITPTPTPTPECPWYGTPEPSGANCLYEYQGELAAAYANNYKTTVNPNFCGFNYGGVACAEYPNTDCTNFVSQALHYGGLPMTQAWNCQLQSTSGQLVCSLYPGNWAGATLLPQYLTGAIGGTNLGANTNIVPHDASFGGNYEYNTGLVPHTIFAATSSFASLTKGDVLYTNQPSGGEHMAVVVGWGPYFTRWSQLEAYASGGEPTSWAYWCDAGYDTSGNLIRKRSIDNGQIQADIFATADERGACDSPASLSATRTTCCSVPYVIDHGGNYRRKNYVGPAYAAGPKPYYVLFWAAPGLDPDAEANLGAATPPWSFISIPTEPISFPMSSLLDPATFETREEMAP